MQIGIKRRLRYLDFLGTGLNPLRGDTYLGMFGFATENIKGQLLRVRSDNADEHKMLGLCYHQLNQMPLAERELFAAFRVG